MLYFTLHPVGRPKMPFIREGCVLYAERIAPMAKLTIDPLSAGTPEEENARLLKKIDGTNDVILVLDERGKGMTSEEFSLWLSRQSDQGRHVTGILGGAYGLSDDVRGKADLVLSLSDMTLPHELAQLLFLEQLYRALSIAQGGKYHHGESI